jgi:hypothetical protein
VNTTQNIVQGIPIHPESSLHFLALLQWATTGFVAMRNSRSSPPSVRTS